MPPDGLESWGDLELVMASRTGREDAFTVLVQRHQGAVGRVVIRMLGPGDEADDVAQETFIRFHGALGDFRGEAAVSTYLRRIAINLSLNAIRRRRWQVRRFVRRDVEGADRSGEPTSEQPESLEHHELQSALEAALARLSDQHRSVVVLRILEEYSTRETAELLRIPEGTVMSRLTRALQKLQVDLRASGMEAP